MTQVTDNNGTRWVDDQQPKRKAPAKGRRFADVKLGDQLTNSKIFDRIACKYGHPGRPLYFIVTEAWFDPVVGQKNREKGELFAVQRIGSGGVPTGRKDAHTRIGLATRGYYYADIDYIAFCKNRAGAGSAFTPIGMGHIIRRRHKTPDGTL